VSTLLVSLALTGDLEAWADAVKLAMLQAVKSATEDEAYFGVLNPLRDDIREAGLGDRLPNTWRLEMRPGRGRLAYNPAAFIRSAAPLIIDGFSRSAVVKAGGGRFMAVPVKGGPMDRIRLLRGETSVQAAERRLGKLTFVPVRQGLAMLVTKSVRQTRSGRYVRVKGRDNITSRKDHETGVPVFFLVPQIRMTKRLSWEQIANQASTGFGERVEAELRRRIAAVEMPGLQGQARDAWLAQQGPGFSRRLSTVSLNLD
jgi:hypothetical protein